MKPFNTVLEAENWIRANARGDCEVYVFTPKFILGGFFEDGKLNFR